LLLKVLARLFSFSTVPEIWKSELYSTTHDMTDCFHVNFTTIEATLSIF